MIKLLFTAPLLLLPISQLSQAQEAKKETIQKAIPKTILAAGNTWIYDVTLSIPADVKFKPDSAITLPPEKTEAEIIYKFTEKQLSHGLEKIDTLDAEVPVISIFINDVLKKKQVLNYVDGQLHYHGTFVENKEDPTKKTGFITIFPIVLYNEEAKVATKWSWTTDKMPKFEFRVVSKTTKIEVLGKTYTADKIRMDELNRTTNEIISSKEYWFAEGIGIVKEQEKRYVSRDKAIVKTLELKSFSKANN